MVPPLPLMLLLWSRVQDSSLATGFSGQPRWGKVLIVIDCGSLSHFCLRATDGCLQTDPGRTQHLPLLPVLTLRGRVLEQL